MTDGQDVKRRQGAVTALALLVSFLFGFAPIAAQAAPSGDARLGSVEVAKRGTPLRTSIRSSQSDDQDDGIALLPPPPLVVTELSSIRAIAAGATPARTAAPRLAPRAYRARAPPAA